MCQYIPVLSLLSGNLIVIISIETKPTSSLSYNEMLCQNLLKFC